MGKREEIRKKRIQKAKRQQGILIAIVVGIALLVTGFIIIQSLKPVGDIVALTVRNHPQTDGLTMGDPNASIVVEEFSDFQCVACYRFWEGIEEEFITNYVSTGKVFFKYSPFSFIGPESFQAAEAAYCANEQNQFWDYHDMIFQNWNGENVGNFSDQRLIAFASSIGLDEKDFKNCFTNNKYNNEVQTGVTYGNQSGVTATPSFLVNGELVYSDALIEKIDSLLGN
jgi:protein-disulfide isomerase